MADSEQMKKRKPFFLLLAIACLLLSSLILGLYWQVTGFDFVTFDDPVYVVNNRHVQNGLSFENLRWAFHLSRAGDDKYWQPLTYVSYMIDNEFFGLKAGMYHFSNVLFHLLNTVLLFFVLWLYTRSMWKSWFAAALFAIHPVNVDTVAWISERNNVLSTFFWMVTLLAYFFYTRKPLLTRYALIFLLFVFGLLSKPMIVTLPFVLLLLDYWPLNRIVSTGENLSAAVKSIFVRQNLVLFFEKIPLIILSIASIIYGSRSMSSIGAFVTHEMVPLDLRIKNAIVSYVHYIFKMFLPINLTFYYPFPREIPIWQVLSALILLVVITYLAFKYIKKYPYFLFGWLWYLGTLIPVSGIIQGGLWPQIAERWAYIPYIGIFIILSWGVPDLLAKTRRKEVIFCVLAVMVILSLSVRTWDQISYWKDDFAVNTRALEINPDNSMAHNNLSVALMEKGDFDDAVRHCREASRIDPKNPDAYINMSKALFQKGDVNGAAQQLRTAIQFNPNDILAHDNLGKTLFENKEYDESLQQFHICLQIDPEFGDAYRFIGNIMLSIGNYNEAVENYKKALGIDPTLTEVQYHLGLAYFQKGVYSKSIKYLEKVGNDPHYSEVREYINRARSAQAQLADELARIKALLKKDPDNPEYLMSLGNIYLKMGEYTDATEEFHKVLVILPDSIPALYGLAIISTEKKDYATAVNILQQIKRIQPDNPDVSYNLACVYSKQNMKNESIQWLKNSVDKGFHNWDQIRKDPDLMNVRNTPYMIELLKKNG